MNKMPLKSFLEDLQGQDDLTMRKHMSQFQTLMIKMSAPRDKKPNGNFQTADSHKYYMDGIFLQELAKLWMVKNLCKSVKYPSLRTFRKYCTSSFLRKICRDQYRSSYLSFSYIILYVKSQVTEHTLVNSIRISLLQACNFCHLLLRLFLRSCAHLHDQEVIPSRTTKKDLLHHMLG